MMVRECIVRVNLCRHFRFFHIYAIQDEMKYSEAKQGRTFILRLEDGEILHETIETFASDLGLRAAVCVVLGGADEKSVLVAGPEQGRAIPVKPMEHLLEGVHEISGTGTIFPNAAGEPVLHMHIAAGRENRAVCGCVRRGVKVWHVMEVVIIELTGTEAKRVEDPETGFELLKP